jgi:hypothetical protein
MGRSVCRQKIDVLDYYEAQGQPLSVHIDWTRSRGGKAWVIPPHDGAAGDKVFKQSYKSAILSHVADACGLMCIHYDQPEGLRGVGNGIGGGATRAAAGRGKVLERGWLLFLGRCLTGGVVFHLPFALELCGSVLVLLCGLFLIAWSGALRTGLEIAPYLSLVG